MECYHDYRIRHSFMSNGRKMYRAQCVKCGHEYTYGVKKPEYETELVDVKLREQYRENEKNKQIKKYTDEREKQHAEFIEWYSDYLTTPEWKAKRLKTLERDKYLCQGCLNSIAEVVHHLTYANVGDELLFQLVSLCHECHKKAHAK